ncbi:MAG: type II toxin-antitoxin system VapC family toxin [Caulobacteraceae bacterium]
MKGVLLDTHVLVWWRFDDPRLSATARRRIERADVAYVSAASIYEIDAKRRRAGESTRAEPLSAMPGNLPETLPSLGFTLLDIGVDVAWRAANLAMDHGDPWDRILVAQARALGAPLITADRRLLALAGDIVVW